MISHTSSPQQERGHCERLTAKVTSPTSTTKTLIKYRAFGNSYSCGKLHSKCASGVDAFCFRAVTVFFPSSQCGAEATDHARTHTADLFAIPARSSSRDKSRSSHTPSSRVIAIVLEDSRRSHQMKDTEH